MEIGKKLDTDKDLEFLNSGDLVHASNIVINNKNASIQNENAIEKYTKLEDETEEIVGTIACSDEFILFTNKNNIIRHNEKTKENVYVQTNWKWGGGEVFGSYTYNVNNELIIAISERNINKDVPLKIINLNNANYEFGENDNKYTLVPPIPKSNLKGFKFVSGNNIYKGIYCFFIRYKAGTDYTNWFKIGYPIMLWDINNEEIVEDYSVGGIYTYTIGKFIDNFKIKEYVDSNSEKISKNIELELSIFDYMNYDSYQIGYIVNTLKNEVKYFTTSNISFNIKKIIIDNFDNNDNFSIDEVTSTFFNLYNVNTLCNYNNRLYIANYKEENNNFLIKDIDTSKIQVSVKEVVANNAVKLLSNNNISKITTINNILLIEKEKKYIIKFKFRFNNSVSEVADYKEITFNMLCSNIGEVTVAANKKYPMLCINGNDIQNIIYIVGKDITKKINTNAEYYGGVFIYINPINNTEYKIGSNQFYKTEINISDIKSTFLDQPIEDLIILDIKECSFKETLNQHWFYEGHCKINQIINDFVFYNEYKPSLSTYFNNEYTIYKDSNSKQLYVRSDSNHLYKECSLLKNNINIGLCIKKIYPTAISIKFNFFYKTELPITEEVIAFIDNRLTYTSDMNIYSDAIMYDNITKDFHVFIRDTFDSTNIYNVYNIVKNNISIKLSDNTIINENISSFITLSDVVRPNENMTIDEFIENNTLKYEWIDDFEATEEDFDPTKEYYAGITAFYNNDTSTGIKNVYKLISNIKVHEIGYGNTIDVNDYLIQIQKHYCIVVPFTNYLGIKYLDTDTYKVYKNGKFLKEGYIKDLYIIFDKRETYDEIDLTKNYNGRLVQIKEFNKENKINIVDYTISIASDNIIYNIYLAENTEYYRTCNYRALLKNVNDDIDIPGEDIYNAPYRKFATNNAIYNFFIHYVYPNGNYTDGILIQNNDVYSDTILLGISGSSSLTKEINEDTRISDIKSTFDDYKNKYGNIDTTKAHPVINLFDTIADVRFCNIFPKYNNRGIALYKNNNGIRMFRGNIHTNDDVIDVYKRSTFNFVFDNIPIKKEFVGYFISYEKSEPILIGEGILLNKGSDLNTNVTTNTKSIKFYYPEFNITKRTGGNILIPHSYVWRYGDPKRVFKFLMNSYEDGRTSAPYENIKNVVAVKENKVLLPNDSSTNNLGLEGVTLLELSKEIKIKNLVYDRDERYSSFGILLNITDNLYMSENKELISMGFIKYVEDYNKSGSYGYENFTYNMDYFLNKENVYTFNRYGIYYDEINPIPKRADNNTQLYANFPVLDYNNSVLVPDTPIMSADIEVLSLYPLNAKTIKNKPIEKYYTYHTDDNSFIQNIKTIHLYPTYINDIFEMNKVYLNFVDKFITNYNEKHYYNFIYNYNKTIRRSNIINDESVENKWKVFMPEQYKIISENKGDIINLVGIGSYLIAHCEHSMFVFNRDSSMKTEDKNVQLVIPDAFDIDYVEMFTSTKGYAGIQKHNQYICSNYGYIFYDSDAHKLYRYDENSLIEITTGFKHLFDKGIDDINFVIDEANERFIALGYITENDKKVKFTISYSFNSKYWISTHSYWYNKSFNTKNNVYFIDDNHNQINSFNKSKYNSYTDVILDENNIYKEEHLKIENSEDILSYSFVDVLFNKNNIDKVLNYITYIVNEDSVSEYSGDKLLIYTNCCYSDYIDISKPRKKITDHKNPYYRYGIWTMNWFRNKIRDIKTNVPIYRHNGKTNNDIIFEIRKGLDNSLIVGKYFVIRLIFKNKDKVININDIQCY